MNDTTHEFDKMLAASVRGYDEGIHGCKFYVPMHYCEDERTAFESGFIRGKNVRKAMESIGA